MAGRPKKKAAASVAETPQAAKSNKCPTNLFDPTKGDKTPAVIEWHRENWTREQFLQKYHNRGVLTKTEQDEATELFN